MSNFFDDNKSLFITPRVEQHNSHQVMTNVIKTTKKKYFNINTKFCNEYSTNFTTANSPLNIAHTSASATPVCSTNLASYTFTLPEKINEVKSISVKNIEIPNTFYTISSLLGNNVFKITQEITNTTTNTKTTVSKVCTISDGCYTDPEQLSDVVNNAIINAGLNSSICYGCGNPTFDNTNTLFGSNTNILLHSYFFVINSDTTNLKITTQIDFAINSDGTFNKYNFKYSLGWLLGFRNNTYKINYKTPMATSLSPLGYKNYYSNYKNNLNNDSIISSENYVDVIGSKYFYLAIDEFSKGNQNSFISTLPFSLINKNIIAKISTYSLGGTFQFYSLINASVQNGLLLSDKREYNGKTDIQKLFVQLIDENGNCVNLNGFDFSFCLEIEYEP